MRVILIFPFLLALLVGCEKSPTLGPGNDSQLASAAQADCGFVQNAYGERVSWKTQIPVLIKIHKSYPTEFINTLKTAAGRWDEAAGMTLFRFEEDPTLVNNKATKEGLNTLHWMMDWAENAKAQQGVTNLYWVGNQLREADVAINSKYFSFYTTTATNFYDVHLESLLVHELGHVLGLKHRSTVPSVMWSVLNAGTNREVLTAADRETIKCEY